MPDNNDEDLQKLFQEIIAQSVPSKIVSNFVMVAELADAEGTTLSLFVSDQMSPWLAQGMLRCAIEMVAENTEADED